MTVDKPLSTSDLQVGQMARVECQLSAEGVSVTWLKDSKELEMGAKYQATTEGRSQVLLIKGFEASDQGVYTCVTPGDAESSINLNLKGRVQHETPRLAPQDLEHLSCTKP